MKKTEQDMKVFQALHDSTTGQWLVEYVTRLSNWVCDVRCPLKLDVDARVALAAFLEENLVSPVQGTKLNQRDKILDSYE